METVYEASGMRGAAHVSCIKYKNLNNISHYHKDHELVYINKGVASVVIDENFFHLKTGDCAFVHSNDIHCIRSDENTVITVLKAENEYFKSIFASKRLIYPILTGEYDMESRLDSIGAELTSRLENSSEMADSIAMQLLIRMLREEGTLSCDDRGLHKSDTRTIYHKICKKIAAEYATITFQEMAEYMHFSDPYFSKVFHSIFGMTFTQYLNTVRIVAAIEKIKNSNLSVTEIAVDCGFNTIRNFNRVFKKLTGYTPNCLPTNYVFLYSLRDGYGLNPTLNCTEILEWDRG